MKTADKIQRAFEDYGIYTSYGKIQDAIDTALEKCQNEESSATFVRKAMYEMCGANGEDYGSSVVQNMDVFLEKFGIEGDWKGIPNWFGQGIVIENYNGDENFTPTTSKGIIETNPETFPHKLENEPYFMNKLDPQKREEFLVKKVFDASLSTRRLVILAVRHYMNLDKQLRENQVFKTLYKKIKRLLVAEFKANKKMEVSR